MSNTEQVVIKGSKDIGQAMVYILDDGREATIFKGGHEKTIDLLNKTIGKAIQLPLYFSKQVNQKTKLPYLNISPMFEDEKYKPGGGTKSQVLTSPVASSNTPAPALPSVPSLQYMDNNKHKDHCVCLSYAKDVVGQEIRAGSLGVGTIKIEDVVNRIQEYSLGMKKILEDMDKLTPA